MKFAVFFSVALGYALAFSGFAFSQQTAIDQDARVVENLRKNGSDFAKLHRVDYFFVMPTEASARAIASELGAQGYAVKNIGISPKQMTWEVFVQRMQLIELKSIQADTVALTQLANRFGGMYDGWGAPVAR